jgi:uncharacterized protein YdhG (YjbR/CyaY superfamily)
VSQPSPIDAYIAAAPPAAQPHLETILGIFRAASPGAEEAISYGMATLRGRRVLVHVGAFKDHVGVYPPVQGEDALIRAFAPWAGPKGNLRFPLDEKLPVGLLRRLARNRARADAEETERAAAARLQVRKRVSLPRERPDPPRKRVSPPRKRIDPSRKSR